MELDISKHLFVVSFGPLEEQTARAKLLSMSHSIPLYWNQVNEALPISVQAWARQAG